MKVLSKMPLSNRKTKLGKLVANFHSKLVSWTLFIIAKSHYLKKGEAGNDLFITVEKVTMQFASSKF